MKEEEPGVEKGCGAVFAAHAVSLGHVGDGESVEDVKESPPKTITGVGVEVTDLIIVVASKWRWSNTDEKDGHRPARILYLFDAQGVLDTATRDRVGTASFKSCRPLPARSGVWMVSPVILPPGRAKLATRPVATGSVA